MSELPTAATPPTTHKATRTLAALRAARQAAALDVAECLGAIADLVERTGNPDAVFAWCQSIFSREDLQQLAAQHRITLHESRAPMADQLTETVVIWTVDGGGLAVIPHRQSPAETLAQLRAAIAEREEETRLSAAFQASVAAGHVEDVDTWHARTTQADR